MKPFSLSQLGGRDGVKKARFANALATFVASGFEKKKFTPFLYGELMMCFSHIAHYDRDGFYDTWFSDAQKQRDWALRAFDAILFSSASRYDVELAIQKWLEPQLDGLLQRAMKESALRDRAELRRLQEKHPEWPEWTLDGK